MQSGLSQNEFYNAHKILSIFKELTNYKVWKNEVFDCIQAKKIFVYYLKLEQNNIPISEETYKKLKDLGVREVII